MEHQSLETGTEIFTRLTTKYSLNGINPKLFPSGGPLANSVIEIISSTYSNDLLVDFIVRCVLPSEVNEQFKGSGTIFINCENHISIFKIINVMNAQLKLAKIKNNVQGLIETALKRLWVLNCYTLEQLHVIINTLEKVVLEKNNIDLVVIDNLGAFYWIEKENSPWLSLDSFCKANFNLMHNILKNLDVLLIVLRAQPTNANLKVDFQIKFVSCADKNRNCELVIFNYLDESKTVVPCKVNKCLLYL